MPPQPLLARVDPSDMSEFWKKMWTAMNDVAGEAVVLEVMANHPAVHEFYVKQFYNKFFHNKDGDMSVEIRLKELLRLRLAVEHGCHVCNSSNFITARAHGFTDEQVRGVGDPTPGLFDERELAIIDFASMMTLHNVQGQLTPELYARLREYSPRPRFPCPPCSDGPTTGRYWARRSTLWTTSRASSCARGATRSN